MENQTAKGLKVRLVAFPMVFGTLGFPTLLTARSVAAQASAPAVTEQDA